MTPHFAASTAPYFAYFAYFAVEFFAQRVANFNGGSPATQSDV